MSLGTATSGAASMLTLAGGTLSLEIGGLVTKISFPLNVPALPLSVSSGGGSFTEPASIFTGRVDLPTALFTGVPIIHEIGIAVTNGTKVLAQGAAGGGHATGVLRAGGGFGGPGPLAGSAVVDLHGLINMHVPLYAIGNTGATLSIYANQQVQITIFGTGWTTGAATLTKVTTAGVNTVTFVGYDNRTPAHNGIVQLVSPFKVTVSFIGNLPGLATQTLTFAGAVPEPGTLALFAVGAAALALFGWHRRP
jgi:hypothetical protein